MKLRPPLGRYDEIVTLRRKEFFLIRRKEFFLILRRSLNDWLVYRHSNSISVVIEPAPSLIHARLRAAIDGLGEGDFTEGHELDRKWKVAKQMVGRRLSQEEAKRLLAKLR